MSKKRLLLLLLVLALLAFSSILLAACSRTGAPSASSSSKGNTAGSGNNGNGGNAPMVHMGPSNFVQPSVTVPKGSKLKLVDDGTYLHILQNGSWVNGAAKTATGPGAPTVNNVQVNSGSIEIGPFTTAGTFHIYCTVHQNMNLTVMVK
jgi:plastocyanin